MTAFAGRLAATADPSRKSAWWLAAAVLAIVATCEFVVMLVLALFPSLPAWQEAIADALLLSLIAAPLLWFVTRGVARRLESAERGRLAARMGAILTATADGIIVTDGEGRILSFNGGAANIFGYAEGELVGKSINVLVPPRFAARHDEQVRAFRDGTEPARIMGTRGILIGYSKDGREIPVEVSIAKAEVEGETTLVAIVRDVSERHRIEAELRAARAQAEAATRAKSEFLANMSHEIRTPMNAVVGLTDLLLDTPLNDEQRDFAETIRGSSDALLGVINDILDLSKIEAGHMELEHAPFDPRHCVETVADLLGPRAAQKRLDLVHEVDDAIPRGLVGDVTRFRQILVNLAGNAIKFTDTGEVFINVRATGVADGRVALEVDVRDTGLGLTPEQQQKMFRPFTQADGSTTRRFGGTGLGLAISRSLVELMGGRIWIQSEPGVGSTFSFSATFGVAEAPAADEDPRPVPLTGKRLLIVDDNATNRRVLIHQVERWGARALPCASPQAALALVARGEAFDLGLLDLHMPGMDGSELARAIRECRGPATPPLLLLSSLGLRLPPDVRQRFVAVLNKPVKAAQLRAAVERAFGGAPSSTSASKSTVDRTLAERHPLRILLADDNAVNRLVSTSMLERFGYQPTVVADGEEAVEIASRIDFDLVFMDMQMPRMDGLEATRRLRLHEAGGTARAFVAAMTANVSREDRQACEAAGMDGFLSKPARLADLQAIIVRAAKRVIGAPSRNPHGLEECSGISALPADAHSRHDAHFRDASDNI